MTTTIKPTNVLLGPERQKTATRLAGERGLSLSAFLRELIDAAEADESTTQGDIIPLIGMLGPSPEPTDISRDKHEMIRQAFLQIAD